MSRQGFLVFFVLFASTLLVVVAKPGSASAVLDADSMSRVHGGSSGVNNQCGRNSGSKCYGSGLCLGDADCRPRCTFYAHHQYCENTQDDLNCSPYQDPDGCGEKYDNGYCDDFPGDLKCHGGTRNGHCVRNTFNGNGCPN